MGLQTNTTIKIGEIVLTNFDKLTIDQIIHGHHSFSFEVRQDLLVQELKSVMPLSQRLFGEKITIETKPIDNLYYLKIDDPQDYLLQFSGIITQIENRLSTVNNIEQLIVIKGHSSTILLDDTKNFNSFTGMTLTDIVNKAKEGYDVDMTVRPFFKDILSYTVQSNENCFEFLNRLAKRYGQWFYDTGRGIIFGSSGTGTVPKLIYGVNMQDFSYRMTMIPTQLKVIENDNREGENTNHTPLTYRREADGFHQNFINKGNKVFSKESRVHINQNAVGGRGKYAAEEYAKNKMRSMLSRMMEITATCDLPGIMVGNAVRIHGIDMQQESSYRVTSVTHYCGDGYGYENRFTAVNFNGSLFSPETDPDLYPIGKSQTAVVTANADPQGLSGIQIQMPWQEASGQTTPYMPFLQKYGGNARGIHQLPEIGDTVYVEFQGDNAEMPIVTGTMTSTKEKSSYSTPNNDLKVMHTRSGIKFICNDEEKSVLIEDPSGNSFFLDGNGSIKLNSPKNIEINAGEDIIMIAGNDVKIEAQRDIRQIADRDIDILAAGSINEAGNNKTENISDSYTRSSHESTQIAEEVQIFSTKENMLLESSQKTVEINSGERTNFF